MYERFYRLRERPFSLTPDPDYLYPSKMHSEALGYLRYGIESHAGFVVITGAIGSGKTTLLQTLLRNVDNRITVARVMNTLLDPRELIEAAMIDVGLDPSGMSRPAMLRPLMPGGSFAPPTSRNVGARSIKLTKSSTTTRGRVSSRGRVSARGRVSPRREDESRRDSSTCRGQRAASVTRTPKS